MTTTAVPPTKRQTAPRRARWSVGTVVQLGLLVLIVVLPCLFVVFSALSATAPRPGELVPDLTLDNFGVLATGSVLKGMGNSAIIGGGATVVAMVVGCGLAFLSARTDVPGRSFIYLAGVAPMFLPALVGALAWALLGSPASGLLNVVLRAVGLPGFVDVYGFGGLIFVLGLYYAPYPFLLVHSALSLMDPNLEDAARLHGASMRRVLTTTTFPLVVPAVTGSAVLVFALTVENFAVAQVLGVPARIDTLPTVIYRLMNAAPARAGEAAVIAMVLTVILMIAVALQRNATARRSFTTVSGKGRRPGVVRLGRWRVPAAAGAAVYFLLAVALPLGALGISALRTSPYLSDLAQLGDENALSLYPLWQTATSADFLSPLLNSLVVGLLAAGIGTLLCFALAYTAHRTTHRGRALLEYLAMLPLAVPAIVLGLGLLWTWLTLPVPVYGTLAVLVIACIAVFLPQGYRGVSASILALDRDLEDSAVMLGARRARAVLAVTAPLLRVGLSSTFLLLLMLAMRELTAVLFLFTTDTRLLSIAIFDAYDNGSLQAAAEISLLYTVVIGFLAVVARRVGNTEES